MPFVAPMLASPLPEPDKTPGGAWAAEEKFDGLRLIIEVESRLSNLFAERSVTAWSRDGNVQPLPEHVLAVLRDFPDGTYDGEGRVPGQRSYGALSALRGGRLVPTKDFQVTLFDVLAIGARLATDETLFDRRSLLLTIEAALSLGFSGLEPKGAESSASPVNVSRQLYVNDPHDPLVRRYAAEVWARDGEGLILKRTNSIYRPGKRPKDWIKLKKVRHAKVRLTGYQAAKLGPHAVWLATDADGHTTSVKWKNLAMLSEVDANPAAFLGRWFWIEYQERTPDASYRHPRFDRWAEEGE